MVRVDVDGRVVGNTENAGVGVEVLVEGELEDGSGALTAEDVSSTFVLTGRTGTYREMMVEYARKKTQMRYQRSP